MHLLISIAIVCVFCKIINRTLPAGIVYEDESVIAFNDINPKARAHILIVPKQHIESIMAENAEDIAAVLIKTAKQIAKKQGLGGYKLVFNVGREGGQIVDHLHLHLLSGKISGEV